LKSNQSLDLWLQRFAVTSECCYEHAMGLEASWMLGLLLLFLISTHTHDLKTEYFSI